MQRYGGYALTQVPNCFSKRASSQVPTNHLLDLAGIFLPIGRMPARSSSNRTATFISSDGIQTESISESFDNATPSASSRQICSPASPQPARPFPRMKASMWFDATEPRQGEEKSRQCTFPHDDKANGNLFGEQSIYK